jgi:hypothetical protein
MEYHKIQTVYHRDLENNSKRLLEGHWSSPEFEFLANNNWVFTEKVDGTNIRICSDSNSLTFKGRTDAAQLPTKLFTALANKFNQSKLRDVFGETSSVVLYGEGYGSGIQKAGKLYRGDQDFVLFDVVVYDSGNDGLPIYLERSNVEDVARNLGIDVVPIIGRGTLYDAIDLVKSGFNSTWGDFEAEGIVARPEIELRNRRGNRIITKIKCRDFK